MDALEPRSDRPRPVRVPLPVTLDSRFGWSWHAPFLYRIDWPKARAAYLRAAARKLLAGKTGFTSRIRSALPVRRAG